MFRKILSLLTTESNNPCRISLAAYEKDIMTILNATKKNKIVILGTGTVGDKNQEFIHKSHLIHKTGFATTPKLIIAGDAIQGYMSSPIIKEKIIQSAVQYTQQSSVSIVRSSGQGDAQGVGIYTSIPTISTAQHITTALDTVIASNYSDIAKAYRVKKGIENEDFAVCIEPYIGEIHGSHLGPELSGRAKTNAEGEREIGLVLGQGGAVDSKHYIHITPTTKILPTFEDTLKANIDSDNEWMCRKYLGELSSSKIDGLGFNIDSITNEKYNFSRDSIKTIYQYNIEKLLSKIEKLDKYCKKPQYIERACAMTKQGWKEYITQIADITTPRITVTFPNSGVVLSDTYDILRSGEKTVSRVVIIRSGSFLANSSEWKSMLHEYNKTHQDYGLIMSSNMTFGYQTLPFDYFSNAAFIIEIDDSIGHQSHSASHYTGLLEATSILFSKAKKFPRLNKDMGFMMNHHILKGGAEPVIRQELYGTGFTLVQDKKKGYGKLYLQE